MRFNTLYKLQNKVKFDYEDYTELYDYILKREFENKTYRKAMKKTLDYIQDIIYKQEKEIQDKVEYIKHLEEKVRHYE